MKYHIRVKSFMGIFRKHLDTLYKNKILNLFEYHFNFIKNVESSHFVEPHDLRLAE